MTSTQPGWFADPSDGSKLRWWNGQAWTEHVARDGATWVEALPASPVVTARRLPVWGWALIGIVGLIAMFLLPQFFALFALAVLITGVVALAKGTPTWLRLKSKNLAVAVTAGAAAVFLVAGAVSANTSPRVSEDASVVGAVPFVAGDEGTESPKPLPTPTPTTREEKVTEPIVFEQTTVDDPATARGQSSVTTAGVDGEKTLTYRITLVNGTEVSRELISEVITTPPVAQVTSVGTYDAPPPPPPAEASGCDSNYADACVPISSDVDCAWGSGNGPAYFDGVARVVGSDIYGLDRDGDSYACEQ